MINTLSKAKKPKIWTVSKKCGKAKKISEKNSRYTKKLLIIKAMSNTIWAFTK